MLFHRRAESEGFGESDLWASSLDENGRFGPPELVEELSTFYGEGDPYIAADGSFVLFTRWDEELGWERSCDIYISFRVEDSWSEPQRFEELCSAGADYSPALSADGRTLYARTGGRYLQRPLAPVLAAAKERAGL